MQSIDIGAVIDLQKLGVANPGIVRIAISTEAARISITRPITGSHQCQVRRAELRTYLRGQASQPQGWLLRRWAMTSPAGTWKIGLYDDTSNTTDLEDQLAGRERNPR